MWTEMHESEQHHHGPRRLQQAVGTFILLVIGSVLAAGFVVGFVTSYLTERC